MGITFAAIYINKIIGAIYVFPKDAIVKLLPNTINHKSAAQGIWLR